MRAPRRPSGIQRRRVVGLRCDVAGAGRGVARIDTGERAEQNRGVANRARHRAGGVLAVRDRNDSRPADQAQRRFDTRRAPPPLTATSPSRRSPCRPRRRNNSRRSPTPDPELDPDGVRSSAYGFRVCPPRPLQPLDEWVERKFAHSLRFVLPMITAPAARNRSATERIAAPRRSSASASEPAVVCIRSAVSMLSLMKTGNAVQRTAHLPAFRSASSCAAIAQRIGVELDHRVDRRAALIDCVDAGEILPRERLCASPVRTASGPADRRSSARRARMRGPGVARRAAARVAIAQRPRRVRRTARAATTAASVEPTNRATTVSVVWLSRSSVTGCSPAHQRELVLIVGARVDHETTDVLLKRHARLECDEQRVRRCRQPPSM